MFNFFSDASFCIACKNHSGIFKYVYLLVDPGFHLVSLVRIYSALYSFGGIFVVPARVLWLFTFYLFSCDISPKAKIRGPIYFPHPIGIVIGEGVSMSGANIIYQNCTLGQNRGVYPTIRNSVIYPGSIICGPASLDEKKISAQTLIIL